MNQSLHLLWTATLPPNNCLQNLVGPWKNMIQIEREALANDVPNASGSNEMDDEMKDFCTESKQSDLNAIQSQQDDCIAKLPSSLLLENFVFNSNSYDGIL
mmetsp:Transcript_8661/g.21740  ORF Transcript_8661/g.21740 Transcript_8661/m.21740 type:complete len:101 (+) Transcript_8661:850-1152(+)